MTVINLEPKDAKPDLVVAYKGTEYVLPGMVNADFLELTIGSKEGTAFFVAFMQCIVPNEMKAVLPEADLMQLADIWSTYVNAPKDSSSNE